AGSDSTYASTSASFLFASMSGTEIALRKSTRPASPLYSSGQWTPSALSAVTGACSGRDVAVTPGSQPWCDGQHPCHRTSPVHTAALSPLAKGQGDSSCCQLLAGGCYPLHQERLLARRSTGGSKPWPSEWCSSLSTPMRSTEPSPTTRPSSARGS